MQLARDYTQTLERAYACADPTSAERATELPIWTHHTTGAVLMAASDQSHSSAASA